MDESVPGAGSTIVELADATPFGRFAASAPGGMLRFVPSPAPQGADVVVVLDPGAARSCQPAGPGFLAVTVRSIGDLTDLADLLPDFLVLEPGIAPNGDGHADGTVAAIVAYADSRSIGVVATGIDDQLCYDRLRMLGVRYGAGPHIDQRLEAGDQLAPAHTPQERSQALRARLQSLGSAAEVASAVCDHVDALGLLPSVYVERSGLLRCMAQRGYWQVMDGIPVGMGVLGRAYRRGRAEHVDATLEGEFIAAAPGLVAEVVVPVRIDGEVRAVFSVECTRSFEPGEIHEIERIGVELERALQRVGLDRATTALHALARANAELASSPDEATVAHTAVRMACTVAGASSAMIALPDLDSLTTVRAAAGPLAKVLRRLDGARMTELAQELGGISSCMAGGDEDGHVQPVFDDIRRNGGTSLVVFPVRCEGEEAGLLFVADAMPGGLEVEAREAMELLAGAIARTLDHVRVHDALRLRAERDSLTMVGSRGAFDDALVALDGGEGEHVAIVLADIDWFKQVNDRLGHHTGDQVLIDTAQAMLECLRQDDQLFRIGGDEFAIVLRGVVDGAAAAALADRLVMNTRKHLSVVDAGLSVGVAVRQPGERMQDCMVRADRLLYEEKARRPLPVR